MRTACIFALIPTQVLVYFSLTGSARTNSSLAVRFGVTVSFQQTIFEYCFDYEQSIPTAAPAAELACPRECNKNVNTRCIWGLLM
jgi:hypothetical protein